MTVKQEVLDIIKDEIDCIKCNHPFTHDDEVKVDKLIDLYYEINRSITDVKVVKSEKYNSYRCPCCNAVVYISQHYCSQCGQKLDWRNANENLL